MLSFFIFAVFGGVVVLRAPHDYGAGPRVVTSFGGFANVDGRGVGGRNMSGGEPSRSFELSCGSQVVMPVLSPCCCRKADSNHKITIQLPSSSFVHPPLLLYVSA